MKSLMTADVMAVSGRNAQDTTTGSFGPTGGDASACRGDILGGAGLGATVGASLGTAVGPAGSAIGGMVGALAGGAIAAQSSTNCERTGSWLRASDNADN
jgi:hypothetical protein